MKYNYIVTSIIWILFQINILADTGPLLLSDLSFKKENAQNNITLSFDGEVFENQITTQYIGNTIQIKLANVYSLDTSKFFDTKSDEVKKIFMMQAAPNLIVLRLVMNQEANLYQNSLKFDIQGKKANLSINSPVNAQAVTSPPKSEILTEATPVIPKESTTELPKELDKLPDITSKITIISLFLSALIVISLIVKKLTRQKNITQIAFKEGFQKIGSLKLDAKRNLHLVKIGEATVIVGIGGDQISLLQLQTPQALPKTLPALSPIKNAQATGQKSQTITEVIDMFRQRAPQTEVKPEVKPEVKSEVKTEAPTSVLSKLNKHISKLAVNPSVPEKKASSNFESLVDQTPSVKVSLSSAGTQMAQKEDQEFDKTIADVSEIIRNKMKQMNYIGKAK